MVISSRIGDLAVVVFENPPLNVLSVGKGLVDALGLALNQALAEAKTKAIVIRAEGICFSAGADLADLSTRDDTLDRIRWLTDLVENANKPVIMAMHGVVLGGGMEFALAGHYRICTAEAQFALPEVKLGILPGAGGTQRLPRLVGAEFALGMMLGGEMVSANEALARGLVDRIASHDLLKEALDFAATCIGHAPRRSRDLEVTNDRAAAAPNKSRPAWANQAPDFIIRCVEAACSRPFREGMALEKRLFEELRLSEASQGLRHVFFGRREVSRIPGTKGIKPNHAINSVTVIGAGLMGTGITLALLNARLKVELIEPHGPVIEKALKSIRSTLDRDVAKGRLSAEAAAERLDLLSTGKTVSAASGADLVIEAVFEDIEVKRQVFSELDRVAKPSAILASNTSTLDLDRIAGFTSRPGQVVGLHFFSPANIMKLVEIVRGEHTSLETLVTAMNFVKAIGKVGVISGVSDGFIGNRMFEEYLRQAYFLLEEGALPQQVDAALEAFGMAMGPFKVMDLAGQDIGWSIRKRRAAEQPDRPYSRIPDLVCELGRYGQKTGAGFYLYPDGRTPQIDPAIDILVRGYSSTIGAPRRNIEASEIVERCIYALVNEGAKILAEKIAYRAIDIDMIYVHGYGFPETRGGPMFYADRIGLKAVLARIEQYRQGRNGWALEPAPLLVELARGGQDFATRDHADG